MRLSFADILERARQGDVGAQIDVAERYRYGWGIIKDEQQAISWYRKAAVAGDKKAISALVEMGVL